MNETLRVAHKMCIRHLTKYEDTIEEIKYSGYFPNMDDVFEHEWFKQYERQCVFEIKSFFKLYKLHKEEKNKYLNRLQRMMYHNRDRHEGYIFEMYFTFSDEELYEYFSEMYPYDI